MMFICKSGHETELPDGNPERHIVEGQERRDYPIMCAHKVTNRKRWDFGLICGRLAFVGGKADIEADK